MGKFCLYYKKNGNSLLGDVLKVKIDDNETFEVNKNEVYVVELTNGTHNFKMYYEGWSSEELVGYIDENIEINGDTYYIYKDPKTIYGKGSLIRKNSKSPEEFTKNVKKSNITSAVLGLLFIILLFIIVIVLEIVTE